MPLIHHFHTNDLAIGRNDKSPPFGGEWKLAARGRNVLWVQSCA